jgi:hypothetical protein
MAARDIEREFFRQNARLRAWRAHGMPVEGRWYRSLDDGLRLRCVECAKGYAIAVVPALFPELTLAAALKRSLEVAVRSIEEQGCPHLLPLLKDDPPEVASTLALELLAGD